MSFQPLAGAVVNDRYRLEHPLGEGGFGTVWKAEQIEFGRPVAIKFLKTTMNLQASRRFDVEARALATLNHANCLAMFESGHAGDRAFIVTEFVDGELLDEWLRREPPLDAKLEVARQILAALEVAHRHHILHRDLKPSNVMVTYRSGALHATVLDFGLAKLTGDGQSDITKTGEVFGTPGFMSPEQLRAAEVGPESDLYMFGAVLFLMLEGRPVFQGETNLATAMLHLTTPAPPITADVAVELAQLVSRLLAKDPGDRYPSVSAVLDALSGADDAKPRAPRKLSPPPAAAFREPLPLMALAAFLVVGLAAVVLGSRQSESPEPARVTKALVVRDSSPLLKQPVKPTVMDLGSDKDASVIASARDLGRFATPGCERRAMPEIGSEMVPGDGIEMLVRVPSSYEPHRAHAVLLMFHEVMQTPAELLTETRFGPLADAAGVVIIAPRSDGLEGIWAPERVEQAIDALTGIGEELCLDRSRIYLFGHGGGGTGVERTKCRLDGVVATATSSYRVSVRRAWERCDPAVPHINLLPLHDGFSPVEGGRGCTGVDKVSLNEHERRARERHGCRGEAQIGYDIAGSSCMTWDCDVPYESCHLNGGRILPGSQVTDKLVAILHKKCAGGAADFPYTKTIWDFLMSAESPSPSDPPK